MASQSDVQIVSQPIDNSQVVKTISVPEKFFEFKGPSKTAEKLSLFKCLSGCPAADDTKLLSCANNTRHNLRRHVKVEK